MEADLYDRVAKLETENKLLRLHVDSLEKKFETQHKFALAIANSVELQNKALRMLGEKIWPNDGQIVPLY